MVERGGKWNKWGMKEIENWREVGCGKLEKGECGRRGKSGGSGGKGREGCSRGR